MFLFFLGTKNVPKRSSSSKRVKIACFLVLGANTTTSLSFLSTRIVLTSPPQAKGGYFLVSKPCLVRRVYIVQQPVDGQRRFWVGSVSPRLRVDRQHAFSLVPPLHYRVIISFRCSSGAGPTRDCPNPNNPTNSWLYAYKYVEACRNKPSSDHS